MEIGADKQCLEWCVDQLEPQVALDDVVDPIVESGWHTHNVAHEGFGDIAHDHTQHPDGKQVYIQHDPQLAQTHRLKNGQGKTDECNADEAHSQGLFFSFIHTGHKATTICPHGQTFRHILRK